MKVDLLKGFVAPASIHYDVLVVLFLCVYVTKLLKMLYDVMFHIKILMREVQDAVERIFTRK